MNFEPTTEQTLLQDSIRRMIARDVQPVLDAHPADRPLPKDATRQVLQAFASQGLTSSRVPAEMGGSEMQLVDVGLVYELLPPSTIFMLLSQEVTTARVALESTPELRERYLPDLIGAKRLTCTATTEPGAGSDPRSVKTRATLDGGHYVVNGRKMWISNASVSDVVNATVSVGSDDRGLSRMLRLLIDAEDSPFETRDIPTLGLRQGHLGEIAFDNCRVPARNALGAAGDAARILTVTWLGNRPLLGMAAVGMATRAFDVALEYAGTREQFGKPIGGHQLVQERLVDIATAITTSRLMCLYALSRIDAGDRANQQSAMAKRYALDACERAISAAMHVHGAMGVSEELGLEQLYRDVRMLPIPDGTQEILTLIAGRELTGLPAYRA